VFPELIEGSSGLARRITLHFGDRRGDDEVNELDVAGGGRRRKIVWPFWTYAAQYGSSEITNSLCGGCRGAEIRDLWIPLSFRPQTAQEPFPCFRASPGYDEFGDDVPPE
jgi:hypothetical protein